MSNIIKDSRVVCRCGDARPARTFLNFPKVFDPLRPHTYLMIHCPKECNTNRSVVFIILLVIDIASPVNINLPDAGCIRNDRKS
jgi:hypothetical protein